MSENTPHSFNWTAIGVIVTVVIACLSGFVAMSQTTTRVDNLEATVSRLEKDRDRENDSLREDLRDMRSRLDQIWLFLSRENPKDS